jgi:AcrR family transcriptional regulator
MEMRDQILAQTTKLFAHKGFDGTTLQEIADAVGIRKPSLLYHFSSKAELRQCVIENMLSHWNEVVPRLLRAAHSGQEQFDSLVRELLAFFAEDSDRALLMVREVLDRPEELTPLLMERVRPWVELVCNYIRKGQRQGRIHTAVDPEAYVLHVINLVVSSLATFNCMGVLIDSEQHVANNGQVFKRHVSELLRVASFSLFVEPEQERPHPENLYQAQPT